MGRLVKKMGGMTDEIKIEKGIPMPASRRDGHSKYPLKDMEVGDSFFVANSPDGRSPAKTIRWTVGAFRKKNTGTKFSVRVVEGGIRVWRTA